MLSNEDNFLFNDELRTKEMLKKHLNYTGSSIAESILDNFENELQNFVKILPIDFENVLLERISKETDSKVVNLWQK